MLSYREINYLEDVPEVVRLLRTSLSEQHSTSFFLWKHASNPFGKSLGLVACDGEMIVGVRMFMFWEFKKADRLVKAVRPVDTVTDKNYRRKGIFRELNLLGLRSLKGKYDLIFNTPNKNSIQGNLSLGWKKYPYELSYRLAALFPKNHKVEKFNLEETDLPDDTHPSEFYCTNHTGDFLRWRYTAENYNTIRVMVKGHSLMIIFRKTVIKGFRVLVINEILGNRQSHKSALRSLCNDQRIFLVYYLNNQAIHLNSFVTLPGGGSDVLYKDDEKGIINETLLSLGDLEGKI